MTSINAKIETLFSGFTVEGLTIPVEYLFYEGHGEPYVVYGEVDKDNTYAAEDEIAGYVVYYDFDIYSTGNYFNIARAVKRILKEGGFTYEPSRDSPQMRDNDTGYYHQSFCFAYPVQEVEEQEEENENNNS